MRKKVVKIAIAVALIAATAGASLFQEYSDYTGDKPYYERFGPRVGPENQSVIPSARDKAPKETAQKRQEKVADVNRLRKEISDEGIKKLKEFHKKLKDETGLDVTMTSFFRDYNPVLERMKSDMEIRVECLKKSGPIECPPGYSKSGSGCHPGGVGGVISYGGGFWENPGTVSYNIETNSVSTWDVDDSDGYTNNGGGDSNSTGVGDEIRFGEDISATSEACPQEINGTIVMVKYETFENGPLTCCLSEPYGQIDPTLCEYCMTNISFSDVDSGFNVDDYKEKCCINDTFEQLFPLCREIVSMTKNSEDDKTQCNVILGGFVVDLDDSISHTQAEVKANQILSGIQSIINGYSGSSQISLLSLGKNETRQVKKKTLQSIVGAIRTYFKENGEARGGVEKVKFIFDGSVYTYHPKNDAFVIGGDPILFTIKTALVENTEKEYEEPEDQDVCKYEVNINKGVYSSGVVEVNATRGALGRATFGNDFIVWFAGVKGYSKEKKTANGSVDVDDIIQNCKGGVKLDDGTCCFTGNIVEDSSGKKYCMECNGKVISGNNGIQCVECPDGYNWDAEKQICTTDYVDCLAIYNDKKPGYFDPNILDSKYHGYPQKGGECVECEKLGLTYKIVDGKIVCAPCPNDQYFNIVTGTCTYCPIGKHLDKVTYTYANNQVIVNAVCKSNPAQGLINPSSSSSGGQTTSNVDSNSTSVSYDIEPAIGSSVLPSVF